MIINKILARSVLTLGSVCCLSAATVSAQEVYSSIIGAVSLTVPEESDLFVTPSFSNSAVFRSEVTEATVGSVTFSSATFDADAYASGHNLLIEEGALAGRMFEITANSATELIVADPESELTGALNQLVSIVPALTLGEMFPNGLGGKVETNPGNPDLVLFSNDNAAGVAGFSPKSIYYYGDIASDGEGGVSSEPSPGWRKVGAPLTQSFDDDIIPLGEGFVVRNNGALPVSFFLFGEVLEADVQIPIVSKAASMTDNLVGAPRPLSITLGDVGEVQGLGLESVVTETTDLGDVKDTVRVFDGTATGKNPDPIGIYCYYSGAWRAVVDGVVDADVSANATPIPATAAIVVRKVESSDEVVYWSNSWDLPAQG